MAALRQQSRNSQYYSNSQSQPTSRPRRHASTASTARKHFVAATGEFVGTFMFLFIAFLGHSMSVTQSPTSVKSASGATAASSEQVVFIALSYGFSLLVSAWTLYRVSGGLFNPAVTLGLVAAGELPPIRGLLLLPAQILGAICAAAVVSAIIPGPIAVVETTLGPGMSIARGVFLEMFLTSQLVLTILVLAADKSKDTFLAPIGIGLALFIVEIAGIYYTGASVNPARSFGPCVAARQFQGYHWIYWVGPAMGGLLAAGFYRFLKYMNNGSLEAANPGQDSADGEFDARIERTVSQDPETGGGQDANEKPQGATYGNGAPARGHSRGRYDAPQGGRGPSPASRGSGYAQYPPPPPQQQQQYSQPQYQQYGQQQQQQQQRQYPPPPSQQTQGQRQSWGPSNVQNYDRGSQEVRRSGSQDRRRY